MIIAQFETPSEGLSSGYFTPLVLAGVLYVVLYVAARVLEGRDDERWETAEDLGFLVMLLSAAYVAILAIVAVASESELVWDLVRILLVVMAFFLVLTLVLFAVFELGPGGVHPVVVVLLTVFTFGIYGYVYYYKANAELAQLGREHNTEQLGTSPGKSLLAITLGVFILIPAWVSIFRFSKRLGAARELTGVTSGVAPIPTFLYLLFLFPIGLGVAQSSLNPVVRSSTVDRAAPPDAVPT